MKDLNITLYNECATFTDTAIENFKYSKAFKYLESYNQHDTRNYYPLFGNIDMHSEEELGEIEAYHVINIIARGYSQGDYQEWDLYFDRKILNDADAMEELKYFSEDMEKYFTQIDLIIKGTIIHEKEIGGEIYTRKEEIDGLCFSFGELDEKEVQHGINDYLFEYDIDKKEYNINWDIEEIIY